MSVIDEPRLLRGSQAPAPAMTDSKPLLDAGSVLVIDDDPLRRAALVCNVARAGASSVVGVSSSEGPALPSSIAPSLIVTLSGPQHELLPEVITLLQSSARTGVVVLGACDANALRAKVSDFARRVHLMALPPAQAELAELVRRYSPLRGVPGPFSPAEYVQQAGLGNHTVSLHCIDQSGRRLGTIVMVRGHVHSARHASAHGFEAFAALVTREDVRVVLGDVIDGDADADLMDHWQSLVLESMRRYDERERGAASARARQPESDFSELLGETAPVSQRGALSRAVSIPALPVTEMRETLGSTRGAARADVRALVEEGVRAVIEQDYPRAIASLEQALAADPRNASVRHRLDRLYAILGKKR